MGNSILTKQPYPIFQVPGFAYFQAETFFLIFTYSVTGAFCRISTMSQFL